MRGNDDVGLHKTDAICHDTEQTSGGTYLDDLRIKQREVDQEVYPLTRNSLPYEPLVSLD